MTLAQGRFTVAMKPLGEPACVDGVTLAYASLDKGYEGDLIAVGVGRMLSTLTSEKGSAGYVAIERVTGLLADRSGSFVLQHSGTMNRGAQQLSIHVVPGSGTGQLKGMAGTLTIEIIGDAHFYKLDYAL